MGSKRLTRESFNQIKKVIKPTTRLKDVQQLFMISESTFYRIKNARSFSEYQANTITRALRESRNKHQSWFDKIKRIFQ